MSILENKLTPVGRLRRLLKVDNKDITQVYIYAIFNGLVNLSLPIGIQAIINLIQGGEASTAWIVLVTFVIAGIALTGILQLLQLRIVENIAQKIFSRASFEFAFRIPRIQFKAFYNYYAPELANRFFDTLTIQKGLPKMLIDFSLALFQIIIGLIVLSFYHPFFVLFSLILVALVYIIVAYTGPRGLRTSLEESKQKYRIAFWLEEVARTKLSFKLIGNSQMELDKNNEYVEDYLEAREAHFSVLIQQFLYLIGFKVFIAAGLLVTGSILVFNQQMNIGQFVAAEILIIIIIAAVEKLIKSLDTIYDVLTALEKIGEVTDMPMDHDEGLKLDMDCKGLNVSIKHLSYGYPDSPDKIIQDMSFDVPEDTSIRIAGRSGSGKSTLLHLISGILEPSSGIISFNNLPYASLSLKHLKNHIGLSLSYNSVLNGTILENIVMGRKDISASDVTEALKMVKLYDFVSSIPLGLKTELDPEGKKIPRSVQCKILLARAIVHKPKLLILEEPLNHLSKDEKRDVIQNLTAENNPWSIIFTSVDPIWDEFVKDYIEIDKGMLVYNSLNK
ncbi:MAG: ATP-binding cassette domain-containing protein [Saprospiraceae bacterium]|nr:ATP-binding cassette domain-containing protein [Saprospiraceae bacterium]